MQVKDDYDHGSRVWRDPDINLSIEFLNFLCLLYWPWQNIRLPLTKPRSSASKVSLGSKQLSSPEPAFIWSAPRTRSLAHAQRNCGIEVRTSHTLLFHRGPLKKRRGCEVRTIMLPVCGIFGKRKSDFLHVQSTLTNCRLDRMCAKVRS